MCGQRIASSDVGVKEKKAGPMGTGLLFCGTGSDGLAWASGGFAAEGTFEWDGGGSGGAAPGGLYAEEEPEKAEESEGYGEEEFHNGGDESEAEDEQQAEEHGAGRFLRCAGGGVAV